VAGVSGVINADTKTITVTLPDGTSLTGQAASFTVSDAVIAVKVNAVLQTSGVTVNDFTNPVQYSLHASDGTVVTWQITVQTESAQVTVPDGVYIWEASFASGASFVELCNTGSSSVTLGVDLFGSKSVTWFLLAINGTDNLVYGVTPLYGTLDADAVLVYGEPSGAESVLGFSIQSGPDGLLLVQGASGKDPDTMASWIGINVGSSISFSHAGTTYTKINALPYASSTTPPAQGLLDVCSGYTNWASWQATGSLAVSGVQSWVGRTTSTPGFK